MVDKIEALAQLRENLVDDIEARHINRLNIALENLEKDVVKLVNSLPVSNNKLFETRLAVEIRPKLKALIDKHYTLWADGTVREYDSVAKQVIENMKVLPIPDKFKTLTEIDIETITNLKRLKFNGFLDIATETTNALADEIYQSTISGKPFEDVVTTLQHKINGVYIKADVDEINDLVELVATTTDEAVKQQAINKLHSVYGADRVGNNMRRYAKQLAHDSLMEFDGQFTKAKATEAGLTNYLYYGDTIGDSRPFCINNRGKIFSEIELRDKWSSEIWKGKSTTDPFTSRGGYNCRHHLQPTDPDWYDNNGNLII
tara:strand:- start:4040 stop:4987 length:948 start_codon:yes stop_codon:yes gene_type:complete